MTLKPDELPNQYTLLDQLEHNELVPFIRTYLRKRNRYSLLYYFCNLLAFGWAGYFLVSGYGQESYNLGDRFSYFAYGLAIAFALVPVHECIHVLAYRSQGARNTSYDVNLKKFYFMALADKFVADRKEFSVVALAPFVTITAILIILFFVAGTNWQLTVIGVFLAHTAMCSGDFGLLSYFEFHREKEVVTYDDVESRRSFFYARSKA